MISMMKMYKIETIKKIGCMTESCLSVGYDDYKQANDAALKASLAGKYDSVKVVSIDYNPNLSVYDLMGVVRNRLNLLKLL